MLHTRRSRVRREPATAGESALVDAGLIGSDALTVV